MDVVKIEMRLTVYMISYIFIHIKFFPVKIGVKKFNYFSGEKNKYYYTGCLPFSPDEIRVGKH